MLKTDVFGGMVSLHHIQEWQPPAMEAGRTPKKSVNPQAV